MTPQEPAFEPYNFELQFARAEAYERESGRRLVRLSDWNCSLGDALLPRSLIANSIRASLAYVTEYADTSRLLATCEVVESNLKETYGADLETAKVHLFGNATQAIFGVVYALVNTVKDPVGLVLHPSYYCLQDSAELCRLPLVETWRRAADGFRIDTDYLRSVRRRHKYNVLFVTDPVYSVGLRARDDEIRDLVAFCSAFGIWLVIDIALSGLFWQTSANAWMDLDRLNLSRYERCVLVDSPSKRLFTNNIKIGVVLANPELSDRMAECSDWHLGNLAGLQLEFARRVFSQEHKAEIETACRTNAERAYRHFQVVSSLLKASPLVSTTRPDSGFHLMLWQQGSQAQAIDAMGVCHRLAIEDGVLVIPTNDFFFSRDDEWGVRLNLMRDPSHWMANVDRFREFGLLR